MSAFGGLAEKSRSEFEPSTPCLVREAEVVSGLVKKHVDCMCEVPMQPTEVSRSIDKARQRFHCNACKEAESIAAWRVARGAWLMYIMSTPRCSGRRLYLRKVYTLLMDRCCAACILICWQEVNMFRTLSRFNGAYENIYVLVFKNPQQNGTNH